MEAQSWNEVVTGERTPRMAHVVLRRLEVQDGEMWLPAAVCKTEMEAELLTSNFGGIVKEVPFVEVGA